MDKDLDKNELKERIYELKSELKEGMKRKDMIGNKALSCIHGASMSEKSVTLGMMIYLYTSKFGEDEFAKSAIDFLDGQVSEYLENLLNIVKSTEDCKNELI